MIAKSGEPVLENTKKALNWCNGKKLAVPEMWALNVRRDIWRTGYLSAMTSLGVDVILCPSYIGVAPEIGSGDYFYYTGVWNILSAPAVVFPTGLRVDPDLDIVDTAYKPRSTKDCEEYQKC